MPSFIFPQVCFYLTNTEAYEWTEELGQVLGTDRTEEQATQTKQTLWFQNIHLYSWLVNRK